MIILLNRKTCYDLSDLMFALTFHCNAGFKRDDHMFKHQFFLNWKSFGMEKTRTFPDRISRHERRKRVRLRGHRRHHLRRDFRRLHIWASVFNSNYNDNDHNNRNTRNNDNDNDDDNNPSINNRSAVVLLHVSDWTLWLDNRSGKNPIKLKEL